MPPTAADDRSAAFDIGTGENACLLLHGFTGTPWDVRPLGDALAEAGYFVRAPLLPGHGLDPAAMERVGWYDWIRAASEALDSLRSSRRVFLAGLSMGALLAMIMAARKPARVSALALIAPAVRFNGPTMTVLRATRAVPWLEWLKPWVNKTATDIEDRAVLREAPILPRFPSARLEDLWRVQDIALAESPAVRAPTLIAVAKHDHVVDPKAASALQVALTGAASIQVLELTRGAHIIPRDLDGPILAREVVTFFGARGAA